MVLLGIMLGSEKGRLGLVTVARDCHAKVPGTYVFSLMPVPGAQESSTQEIKLSRREMAVTEDEPGAGEMGALAGEERDSLSPGACSALSHRNSRPVPSQLRLEVFILLCPLFGAASMFVPCARWDRWGSAPSELLSQRQVRSK